MKKQAIIMGMPVTIVIVDTIVTELDIEEIFTYLKHIDTTCSTYKKESEITKINKGILKKENASKEVKKILSLCDETKTETNGYFDCYHNGKLDPSGIVKGYAIYEGVKMLRRKGYMNFSVEIAGDIEVHGTNEEKEKWRIGIENPFDRKEIIKVIGLTNKGIATSGNYIRGQHIFNPVTGEKADAIMSISVIGPNAYEADRFATAAFAMGEKGILFIEGLKNCEGYMVKKNHQAVFTSGFNKFVLQ